MIQPMIFCGKTSLLCGFVIDYTPMTGMMKLSESHSRMVHGMVKKNPGDRKSPYMYRLIQYVSSGKLT